MGYLETIEQGFGRATQSFIGIINYVLFIGSLLLGVTMMITDRRGDNLGFNLGKWALILFSAAMVITIAKEAFDIA